MHCKEIEDKLVEYLDGRATPSKRRAVERHLAECEECRGRAEGFREIWSAFDDVPSLSPSAGFDASLRARLAAEPTRRGFWAALPSPRLAFAVVVLVILATWISSTSQIPYSVPGPSQPMAETDFSAIRDLPLLENYDVLSSFDALSELPIAPNASATGASATDTE